MNKLIFQQRKGRVGKVIGEGNHPDSEDFSAGGLTYPPALPKWEGSFVG